MLHTSALDSSHFEMPVVILTNTNIHLCRVLLCMLRTHLLSFAFSPSLVSYNLFNRRINIE